MINYNFVTGIKDVILESFLYLTSVQHFNYHAVLILRIIKLNYIIYGLVNYI